MADVEKEFEKSVHNLKEYVVLATVDAKAYQKTNLELVRHLTVNKNIPGVYVTLNKPYKTIKDVLIKAKIETNMLIFIDAVTKTAGGDIEKTKECLFIGSPENLSDISIAMDQAVMALPSEEKFVFFDSLSTLLMYNNVGTVARFVHFLAGKMRMWKVKGVIVSLKKDKDKELIEELTQFCDATLNL